MRIHVCLVSSEAGANEFVAKKQAAAIPPASRGQWEGADFGASAYDPTKHKLSPPDYFLKLRGSCDILVVLLDVAVAESLSFVESACFVGRVDFPNYPRANYSNYLATTIARLLRVLKLFTPLATEAATEQVVLLPFRTFDAQELRDLREACGDVLAPNFINAAISGIEALRGRRRPHRRSGFQDLHYVDDQEKLFEFGLEQHAQFDTGAPHSALCALMGLSRFGFKIPPKRHYNVTREKGRETEISGDFLGCHDDAYSVDATSHINVFSNDFRA